MARRLFQLLLLCASVLAAALPLEALALTGTETVLMMPNRDARANEAVVVWGVTTQPNGTAYVLDYGDGSVASGTVTDQSYIAFPHTYTSQRRYVATLIVGGVSATTQIQVFNTNDATNPKPWSSDFKRQLTQNMAIQDSLRYLWYSQTNRAGGFPSSTTTYWSNSYSVADTAFAALAFQNHGYRLPKDGSAPTGLYERFIVRRALNYVMSQLTSQSLTASVHLAGNACVGFGPRTTPGTAAGSLTIAAGAQTVTAPAGLDFTVGTRVRFTDSTNSANYVEGAVTASSGTSVSITADVTGGAGTHSTWFVTAATVAATDSIAIGTGAKTFTAASGLAYATGARIRAVDASNSENFLEGLVTASAAGSVTISADRSSGAGTLSSWQLAEVGWSGADCGGFKASGEDGYTTSVVMLPFAASGALGRVNTEAGGVSANMTFGEILQRLVNAQAWGQNAANAGIGRGGWHYYLPGDGSLDGSTIGWTILGMLDSEASGIAIPSFVRREFRYGFYNAINVDGTLDYSGDANPTNSSTASLTGVGLQGLFFTQDSKANSVGVSGYMHPVNWWRERVIATIQAGWNNTGGCSTNNKGCVYSMFNNFKGLKLSGVDMIAVGGTQPTDGSTIVVNGVTFTFKSSPGATTDVQIGANITATATNLVTKLNASVDPAISGATYALLGTSVLITYNTVGTGGNSFTLAPGTASARISGATLTGGGDAKSTGLLIFTSVPANASSVTVNGVTFTFKSSPGAANDVQIGGDTKTTAANLAAKLMASADVSVAAADYFVSGPAISVTYKVAGAGGDAFTLATSTAAVMLSGATLTGGAPKAAVGSIDVGAQYDWHADYQNWLTGWGAYGTSQQQTPTTTTGGYWDINFSCCYTNSGGYALSTMFGALLLAPAALVLPDSDLFSTVGLLQYSGGTWNTSSVTKATTQAGGALTTHTVRAHAQSSSGAAVPAARVDFTVVSGPNAGLTGTGSTDASGNAEWTYTYSGPYGSSGTDVIEASIGIVQSNALQVVWTTSVSGLASTVGGTLVGLPSGKSVVLANSVDDQVTVDGAGASGSPTPVAFTFPTTIAAGAIYVPTVSGLPTNYACTVTGGDVNASGALYFSGNPTSGQTLTVNGVTFTFGVASSPAAVGTTTGTIQIKADAAATAAEVASVLKLSGAVQLTGATYAVNNTTVIITYKTGGTAGNAYTLASGSAVVTTSGATITVAVNPSNGETLLVNGVTFTFKTTPTLARDVQIGADATATATNLAAKLAGDAVDAAVYLSTYSSVGNIVYVTYGPIVTGGGSFTLGGGTSVTNAHLTIGGATLAGGLGGATAATGSITLSANPSDNDTVVVNGKTYTFKTTPAGAYDVQIGGDASTTAANLGAALAANVADPGVFAASYGVSGAIVTITYNTGGTIGNGFTLAKTGTAATLSGSTLTGGAGGVGTGRMTVDASGNAASVTSVLITCEVSSFTISAMPTGLGASKAVVLTNTVTTGGGGAVSTETKTLLTNNVASDFYIPVPRGDSWAVTISTQPSGQACELTGTSSGTNISTTPAPVTLKCRDLTIAINDGNSQTVVAGSAVSTAPSVIIKDVRTGEADPTPQPVAGVSITFAVASGGGSVGGATVSTGADGIARVGSWTLGTTAGSNTLTATMASVTPVTFSATGTFGPVTKLGLSTPADITAGGTRATYTVTRKDVNNNAASPASDLVVYLFASGTGGTFYDALTNGNTVTSVTIPSGASSATFYFTSTVAATYTVTASETTPANGATGIADATDTIIVGAGAPTAAQSTISASPTSGVVANNTATSTLTITARDAYGNLAASQSVFFAVTSGTGTLSNGPWTTNASGVATATLKTLVAGTKTVTGYLGANASGTAITSGTASVTFVHDVANRLAFTTQPGGGTGGTAWSTQPVVTVQDVNGNTVLASSAAVTLAITPPDGGATFTCTTNPVNAVNGVATFGGCKIDKIGTYTLTATSTGLTSAVSNALTITTGPAAQIAVYQGNNQNGASGTALSVAPGVVVKDAGGNPVSGISVAFAVASGGGSVTPASVNSDVNGRALVTSWTLGPNAGTNTMTATRAGLTGSPLTFTATAWNTDPLSVVTPALPDAVKNVPYATTVQARGGVPPYSFALTGGSLPAGLTLSAQGNVAGVATTAGSYSITVTVTDAQSATASRTFPLQVLDNIAVVTASLGDGIVGAPYVQQLEAVGGQRPFVWTIDAGELPRGFLINAGTGEISGTAQAPAGTASFTVKVVDRDGRFATKSLTLTTLARTAVVLDPAGEAVSNALIATDTGGTGCASNATQVIIVDSASVGSQPAGITFPHGLMNFNVDMTACPLGSAVLNVTAVYPAELPANTQYWKYGATPDNPAPHWYTLPGVILRGNTMSFTIRDGGVGDDDLTVNGHISDPGGPGSPSMTLTGSLPATVQVGVAASGTLNVTNGSAGGAFLWSVASGSLPPGLSLASANTAAVTSNTVSGTPTTAGTYNFTLQVTDQGNGNQIAQASFTIMVGSSPASYTVTPSASPSNGGTLTPGTPQLIPDGATAAFIVAANPGYTLSAVDGCGGVLVGDVYTTAAVTVSCAVAASFTANAAGNYSISTLSIPSAAGTVTCSPNPVSAGGSSTCVARANTGYTFGRFSDNCVRTTGTTCTISNINSVQTVSALFDTTLVMYTLRAAKTGNSTGSVTSSPTGINCGPAPGCSANYVGGTAVTLLATPIAGAVFDGWTGDCTGKGPCTVTMSANRTATASFSWVGSGSVVANEDVQEAYVAYYGRPAEPGGLAYWALRVDKEGSLASIIDAFGRSDEYNRRYLGQSNTLLVGNLYRQLLGREPDTAGLNWYVDKMNAGKMTLQSIALDVIFGAVTSPDADVVANKMDVANHYTGKVAAGCAYGGELAGLNTLVPVNQSPSTAWAAKMAIEKRCGY